MSIRGVATEAYREAFPALVASLVGGLIAGTVLGGMRAELRAVPGLLVLVPALLATRGNVYGAFGARIATGLHQGVIEPHVAIDDERLQSAVAAALGNGLLVSVFAAVLAFGVLRYLAQDVAPLWSLVAIAFVAGILSGLALTGSVLVVVFVGFRRGHNPDTLVGPLVMTTGDIFGLASLLVAVRLVVGGG